MLTQLPEKDTIQQMRSTTVGKSETSLSAVNNRGPAGQSWDAMMAIIYVLKFSTIEALDEKVL